MEDHPSRSQPKELRALCDEVKRHLDHRTFYLSFCPEAQISGTQLKASCPIPEHQHTGSGRPSLSVDLNRGLYHCFSRSDGGDVIRFYEQMKGVSFTQAVYQMAAQLGLTQTEKSSPTVAAETEQSNPNKVAGITQDTAKDLEKTALICQRFLQHCAGEEQLEGRNYLERRGIDWVTARRFGIVYFPRRSYRRIMKKMLDDFALDELQDCGLFNEQAHLTFYKHRLIFPFYAAGRPVYLQSRTTASGVEPRWHNLRGSVPSLYNIDALAELPSGALIYLVEGFTDTLTLVAHGFTAVGLVGAGGLKPEWLPQLARFVVILALDGDRAGNAAADAYEELFAERGILCYARVNLPTDVNDFFRQRPAASLELTLMTEAALEESKGRGRCAEPERL